MPALRPSLPAIPPYLSALLFYSFIILLIEMADSVMAYVAPIFLENGVKNSFYMGIILSSSSVVGLFCDAIFPSVFRAKQHLFFLWNTVILALLFPAIFLFFPQQVPEFVLAMAIWGIYYEFLVFSKAYFIEAFIKMDRHALAWGILNTFRSLTMFAVPLFVPFLLDQGVAQPLMVTFSLLFLSLFCIVVFNRIFPTRKREVVQEVVTKKSSALKELYIWRSIIRKIWPIFLFILVLFILEATFFSIGILASEELRQTSIWGSFLIPAYMLPNLFTGFFVQRLGVKIGKKRLAFLSGGIGGGLLFVATLFAASPPLLIAILFVSACFSSLAYPAILAVIQDYITRLGNFGGEMVGLQNAAGSIGYIIGPMLAGWVGMTLGNLPAIGVIGLLMMLISAVNILIVPRKIKMPQKELQLITSI